MIRAYRYDPENLERWNKFLKDSASDYFLWNRNFMDYHKDRFEDYSVMIENEKKQLLAIFPAHAKDDGIYAHLGLSFGSLVLKAGLRFQEVGLIFHALLRHYAQNGFKNLYIKPLPFIYKNAYHQNIEYLLEYVSAKCVKIEANFVCNLQKNLQFQQRRLRGIAKASEQCLRIERDSNFQDFWDNVLIPNLRERYDLNPVHSADEIQLLHSRFPDQIQQWNVYMGSILVGGTTLFVHPNLSVVHSQYIASTDLGKSNGSLDLLFFELLTRHFMDYQFFSLGIVNKNDLEHPINEGLMAWKESWGATLVNHKHQQFEIARYIELEKLL